MKAIEAKSPMNSALLFEGSDDVFVSFDIETYSPNGFPYNMGDPIVNFSLASPIFNDLRKGLLTVSYICHPSLEENLSRFLHSFLSLLEGNFLLTYNGSKFDVKYVAHRGNLFGLDFQRLFSNFSHIDLYELIKSLNIKLPSYSQKTVEKLLGFERTVSDVSGASYYLSFANFLRDANLKPLFYNVEDSVGCLRILDGLLTTSKR
jgi:uncharacterized protein YprB with RNaseH-like and TPR domain